MSDLKTKQRNECYTYYKIVGDFDPDTVTGLLGIVPERSWKKGDRRANGTVYDFSCWITGTCREYDVETDRQMMKTLEALLDKTESLNEIKRRYDADFFLEVVPTVSPAERTPCLAPSLEVMRFCCATETNLDIDLYVNSRDKFEVDEVMIKER